MEEQTIVIKIRDGESLLVSKERLTAESRMFRYLIEELKYDELEMDDFTPEAVALFITLLEVKQLGEIEDHMYKEIHKLSRVFEVEWLKGSCISWLRSRINSATGTADKTFTLNESWYIFIKWEDKDMLNELKSCLLVQDNSAFISEYMSDVDRLEEGQIDLMLTLGGSNTDLFLQTLMQNLTGQRKLQDKITYLLQNMNLAFCSERNEELYHHVFEEISNLPEISVADMKFSLKLMSDTSKLVTSRKERKKTKSLEVYDRKKNHDNIRSCTRTNKIIKDISEERVKTMFMVVEQLLRVFYKNPPNKEDAMIFLTTLKDLCSDKRLQKVSSDFLDIIIAALNYSNLAQSDDIIYMLNEIKSNDKLATSHLTVIIKRDKVITVTKEWKELFTFKHPGTGTCTETGKCGFIMRVTKREGNWTRKLCINSEDYTDTGLHYHDIISPYEMSMYYTSSGHTGAGNKVIVVGKWKWWKKWLPDITDWKVTECSVAYNVADYMVAKQH